MLLWLGIPLYLVLMMKFPPMGPFMTELFPTEVRGTAQGFCYNAGRAIGALFPSLVGYFAASAGLGTSIGILSAAAFGLMIIMLLLLPETRGRRLDAIGAAAIPEERSSRTA
jgi:sugar phosphate permease